MIRFSLAKDLIRFLRDPTPILMAGAIPLVAAVLIKVAFGSGGGTPTARLLVADNDQSIVSSVLVTTLRQGALKDLLETVEVSEETGRKQIDQGEASALLIISRGMGDRLFKDEPDTLRLITNPAQSVLPRLVESIIETLADVEFYLQRLVGDTIRSAAEDSVGSWNMPDVDEVTALFPLLRDRASRVGSMIENPPLVLEKKTLDTEPRPSFAVLFLPSLLLMGLLFMAQGLSGDLWEERERGTLRRVQGSACSLRAWLLGKAGAVFVCSGLLALFGLALARFAFGVPVHHIPLGALWMAWTGAALFLLFVLLQVSATSRRGGGILSSVVVFPLAMLGGSFFPFETMPESLAAVGVWTPNGSAIRGLKGILASSMTWDITSFIVVSLCLLLSFFIILWRLKRGMERGVV